MTKPIKAIKHGKNSNYYKNLVSSKTKRRMEEEKELKQQELLRKLLNGELKIVYPPKNKNKKR